MIEYFQKFRDFFWQPKFWLPENLTWSDLEPQYEYQFTDYRDLYTYPFLLAFLLTTLRYTLEKFLFRILGLKFRITDSVRERARVKNTFRTNNDWKTEVMFKLSDWLRYRRKQNAPSNLKKFCESSWKCLYFTISFIFRLFTLWDKPWFTNIQYCWIGYPYQGVTRDIWWLYMLTFAFYLSLLVSQFVDVIRKDFWQTFAHHVLTIFLIYFSWICNFQRIGSLVILVHDAVDCLMEASKCAIYANRSRLKNTLFASFVVVWIVTRLGIFPFWILRSIIFQDPVPSRLLEAFLLALFLLDIYWTTLIVKMITRIMVEDKSLLDARSSSSEGEEENMSLIKNAENYVD